MDERKLKRLALIMLISLAVIMIAKSLLIDSVSKLSDAQARKHITVVQPVSAPESASEPVVAASGPDAISAVEVASEVASAVPATDSGSH